MCPAILSWLYQFPTMFASRANFTLWLVRDSPPPPPSNLLILCDGGKGACRMRQALIELEKPKGENAVVKYC
jgi:hypothetical protein